MSSTICRPGLKALSMPGIRLSAVDLTTSEHPLKDDDDAQKIIHCGQFLAQMFAGGTFRG